MCPKIFRFTVLDNNGFHVRVRIAASHDGGTQWATNGIVAFEVGEWNAFKAGLAAKPKETGPVFEIMEGV